MHVPVHVCIYVRMHVCAYARMHMCTFARKQVNTHLRMHVCTYTRMYVLYVFVCMYVCTFAEVCRVWVQDRVNVRLVQLEEENAGIHVDEGMVGMGKVWCSYEQCMVLQWVIYGVGIGNV